MFRQRSIESLGHLFQHLEMFAIVLVAPLQISISKICPRRQGGLNSREEQLVGGIQNIQPQHHKLLA